MITYKRFKLVATLSLLGVGACHGDFLTGGETSTDPNNPTVATNKQFFAGTQENLWAFWGGDPARVVGIYAQQLHGLANQYGTLDSEYLQDENTTNGDNTAVYTTGGLIDIKKLEAGTAAVHDSVFLGMAQVIEGALMGTAADLFGDVVYKEAIAGIPQPHLDDQLTVYDSVQKVLSAAVVNMAATGPTNAGPADVDLVYGGDPSAWTALAHTLKARFYMHTGEVTPAAYASALAEAQQGISSDAGNYFGAYTSTPGEQNLYYSFHDVVGRGGDISGGVTLDTILANRNDPRRNQYFSHDATGFPIWLSATRAAPGYQQPFVTYDENTLIWAEAAWRTNDFATARVKLNEERANHGLAADTASTNQSLLDEILIEKYIVDFQLGEEAWNDYKRTCTPNLVPTAAGKKIPGRLYYDQNEHNTDPNIPPPNVGVNGLKNRNDPPNAVSDGTGQTCLGQ